MLIIPPPVQYPRKRFREKRAATPTPVGPLTLVAATYSGGDLSLLTLTFDRAVNMDALDGAAILVNDGDGTGLRYDATGGWAYVGPENQVQFTLNPLGGDEGPGVTLDASAGNGIVASADGAAWAGATELALPYP